MRKETEQTENKEKEMTKQIRPEQIIQRIEKLVLMQRQRGYKAGWVFHQMEDKVEANWKHLCIAYDATDLAHQAYYVASGKSTIEELSQYLEVMYEDYERIAEVYEEA